MRYEIGHQKKDESLKIKIVKNSLKSQKRPKELMA
jgi:hypothetical protein